MDSHTFGTDNLSNNPLFNLIDTLNMDPLNENPNGMFYGNDIESPYSSSKFLTSYADPNQFVTKYAGENRLSFLTLNIQSLTSKYHELHDLIQQMSTTNCEPDIICLQETWFIIDPTFFPLPNYQTLIHTNISKSQGGGVGFYVKNGIHFTILRER